MLRSERAFCSACNDTGERIGRHAETDERGTHYSDYELADCPDCPMCPCGIRLADHLICDVEAVEARPLDPSEVLFVGSECWAGECYESFLAEQDGPADEPDLPLAAARGVMVGAGASAVLFTMLALAWGAMR